jgi:hypothetical protein
MKNTYPYIFSNIIILLLAGCSTTTDITTKLVVPESKPIVYTPTPVQLDNSDAKIRIRLASSNPLTNHVNLKLSLTNVSPTYENITLNSAEYKTIPVYFNNYAIDSDKVHLALTYDNNTYPCLWEKNVIINRGQTLDINESVSFTAIPVTIMLPDSTGNAKLSPNIFYKGSGQIDITVGDILGLAGPIDSSRHVVITSKAKPIRLSFADLVITQAIGDDKFNFESIINDKSYKAEIDSLKLIESQKNDLMTISNRLFTQVRKIKGNSDLSVEEESLNQKKYKIQAEDAFYKRLNSEQSVLVDDGYIRSNADQSSVERNVGIVAYEKIKSLKLINAAEVKYQGTITDKGDSVISFIPDNIGEYTVSVWYTTNGQYAYSELKFSVYDRL